MCEIMKRRSKRWKGNTSGERCYRRSTIWGRKFAIEKCRERLDVYLYRGQELRYFLEPEIEDKKIKKKKVVAIFVHTGFRGFSFNDI